MPPLPPLNLNLNTSSEAKSGANTIGGFNGGSLSFGSQQNNTLLYVALAGIAYLLYKKAKK